VYVGDPPLIEAPPDALSGRLALVLAHPARPTAAAIATIAGSDFI
jgi:hypothetical protein